MARSKKERISKRDFRREGSKDPVIPIREHAKSKTLSLEGYQSTIDREDLSLICTAYYDPRDFKLELLGPGARVDNSSPGRLGVFEEAFETRLRFPISPFILELLMSYGVLLCSLTPNSIRLIIRFLALCLLVEIQPSLSLFRIFFTTQKYSYAKVWWYLISQKGMEPLIKGAPAIKEWKERFLFILTFFIDD